MAVIALLSVAGCAGPKFMSQSSGSHQLVAAIPSGKALVVERFETSSAMKWSGLDAGQLFSRELARSIRGSRVFAEVREANDPRTAADTTSSRTWLVLRGSVTTAAAGYGSRALVGSSSRVSVSATLVTSDSERVLCRFDKSRSASGGLLGMGGLLSAGEPSLAAASLRWIAQDLARNLAGEARKSTHVERGRP